MAFVGIVDQVTSEFEEDAINISFQKITILNWFVTTALAEFAIKIIKISLISCFSGGAIWLNEAVTMARVLIPVVPGWAGDWLALAIAVVVVPVEVIWADLWAADASANIIVPNFLSTTIFWRANTCA